MSFPYDTDDTDALDRLSTFYNGSAYDAGSNPGGMAAGGHRINFIAALQDFALLAGSVGDAADYAATQASAAASSAADASDFADKLEGTSTTSVSIGTGSKSFTTQSGKFFDIGTFVFVVSNASPATTYMGGQVTAYSSTSLTVNMTVTSGSGSHTDWTIYGRAGSPGATGSTGSTGATGNTPALQWNFGNGTSDTDPGNGTLCFNNATYSSVTVLFFDNLDKNGITQTTFLDALDDSTNTANRGSILVQQISDPTIFAQFTVNGAVTDGTGYRKVAVSYVNSSGAFTNGAAVAIAFSRTGNAGADGAGAGDTISDISSVTDGRIVIFNGTGGKHITNASFGIGTSGSNLGALSTANTWAGQQSFDAAPLPSSSDGAALGSTSKMWSDLFLASGAVINFNNGDVTITHSSNVLAFAGAATNYTFDANVNPATSDGAALGTTALMWSDAFLASGAVINFNNGDVTITHSSNTLTFGGAASGYKFDALVAPSSSDGAALGSTSLMWSDLFVASGAVLNFNNGNVTLTHASGKLSLAGALEVSSTIKPNGGGAIREVLTATRSYFVRTDGSDSNNGLANTSGGAFLTIQKAIDTAYGLDSAAQTVSIAVADGTYTGAITINGSLIGNGSLLITGNTTTPSNVLINVTGSAITLNGVMQLTISGIKVQSTANGLAISSRAVVTLNKVFLGASTGVALQVSDASCTVTGNFTISGNSASAFHFINGAFVTTDASTCTLSGTPAFSDFFFGTSEGAKSVWLLTFSGSATGRRAYIHQGAVVETGDGSTHPDAYFPGGTASIFQDCSYNDYNGLILPRSGIQFLVNDAVIAGPSITRVSNLLVESGGSGGIQWNNAANSVANMALADAGGLVVGSPTGGNKGAGTINATAVYDDNVLLTCYPFDQFLDGSIDVSKWDRLVPDRVHPVLDMTTGERISETIEARQHDPLRKFMARIGSEYDPINVESYVKHWKDKRHLTSLPNEKKFDPERSLSAGEWVQRLIETAELQAIHIGQLLDRIKVLEASASR